MKPFTLFILSILSTSIGYCQDSKQYAKLSYEELDTLIDNHIEQGKYSDAIPLAKAMINKGENEKNDTVMANGLDYLGALHRDMGNYNKALPLHVQTINIYEKALGKEHPYYAQSLNNLAVLHYIIGNYDNALSFFLKAKNIRGEVLGRRHPDYAESLNNLGSLNEIMGNYSEALSLYLLAKDIHEKVLGIEHPRYALSLNNIANLHESMGNYSEALPLLLQAKDINKKVFGIEHHDYANSIANLAYLHSIMGNYGKALPLQLQAKNIFGKVLGKEHTYYSTSLNNLAVFHQNLGNYNEALTLYLQARDIDEKVLGKEHPTYAVSLNNLANLHERMGNYSEALSLYLQTRNIYEKVLGKEHPSYANSLNNLASLNEKMGNYNKALTLYLQARDIDEKVLGKEHPSYISALNNLVDLHKSMRNYEQAWEVLYQAMNSAANIQLSFTFDKVWSDGLRTVAYSSNAHLRQMVRSLGMAYRLLEKDSNVVDVLNKQIIIADLANALLVKARNQVSNEKDKLRILSLSNDWLQKSLTVLTPEIHYNKAFNLSDENKSVLLLQATKSELAYRLGELPDSLVWQDRNLLKTQSQLQGKLLEKDAKEEKDSLRNELNNVNQDIDEFVKMIEKEYPKYHKIKYQQTDAKVQDVQDLLDANTAFLEYVIGDSVAHIFYVDREQVQWSKSFASNKELKDRIKSLHRSLSDPTLTSSYQEYTENAHWFYQNLVAPALKDKPTITNLIIVTDGELGHLPFEAFLVEKASDQLTDYRNLHYLVNDYNISYNYSATLWKENIEVSAPKNNGQILGMAGNYEVTLDSSMLAVRLPTDQWTRAEISPLPAARREVEALQEKYEGFFAFDTLASEKTVKAMAADFSILHFATHGILDKERPMLSSLAFTEDNDSIESNFWHAYEISKLQLNADLVVLSACETGFGKFEKGNGIASLARAFMYAGTPALVISLWQVNDFSTSELMRAFYDNLDNGMKKDEALRQAKLQYIKSADADFAHPAYWAPFIMMGKTDAVEIKRKSNYMAWGIGFAVLVLLGFGGFMLRKRQPSAEVLF